VKLFLPSQRLAEDLVPNPFWIWAPSDPLQGVGKVFVKLKKIGLEKKVVMEAFSFLPPSG